MSGDGGWGVTERITDNFERACRDGAPILAICKAGACWKIHPRATQLDGEDFAFTLLVGDELERARAKFPDEEYRIGGAEWLRVLVEEVGECAKEINDAHDNDQALDVEALRAELAQVAAVATRWAVSLAVGGGQ